MGEFVCISKLTQRRKDKINCKDITGTLLFNLFDSSVMSQIGERVFILRSLIDRRCGIIEEGGRKNIKN